MEGHHHDQGHPAGGSTGYRQGQAGVLRRVAGPDRMAQKVRTLPTLARSWPATAHWLNGIVTRVNEDDHRLRKATVLPAGGLTADLGGQRRSRQAPADIPIRTR